MNQDPYNVLEVAKGASQDEIKKAYRKLAHKYHPDKKDGDEVKFKELNEAYQTLSDPNKRAQYDRFGRTFEGGGREGGFNGFEFQGDIWDLLQNMGRGGIFEEFLSGGFSRQRSQSYADVSVDLSALLKSREILIQGPNQTIRVKVIVPPGKESKIKELIEELGD